MPWYGKQEKKLYIYIYSLYVTAPCHPWQLLFRNPGLSRNTRAKAQLWFTTGWGF